MEILKAIIINVLTAFYQPFWFSIILSVFFMFVYKRYSAAKNHTPEQRYAYRLEKEKSTLEAFWQWISQQAPKKETRFEKAVNYA